MTSPRYARRVPLVLILLAVLALGGCRLELPRIVSCVVVDAASSGSETAQHRELLRSQLPALQTWFKQIDSGWRFDVSDHPPGGRSFRLTHRDGRITVARLRDTDLWLGVRVRSLTPGELASLDEIINSDTTIPHFGTVSSSR